MNGFFVALFVKRRVSDDDIDHRLLLRSNKSIEEDLTGYKKGNKRKEPDADISSCGGCCSENSCRGISTDKQLARSLRRRKQFWRPFSSICY